MASLALIARYMEEDGVCRTEAARRANIARSNFEKWVKLTTNFNKLDRRALIKKSGHHGPKGQLKSIEDKLLLYVFKMRENGMQIDYLLVLFKAASLSQSFHAKPFNAHFLAIKRFMKRHSYMYRMGTHESQCLPEEVANEARVWMDHNRPLVTRPHHNLRYVINLDQTPVFFFDECKENTQVDWSQNDSRSKINERYKTRHRRHDHHRVGSHAHPVVIFKGAENGRIEKKEFSTYPIDMLYQMQKNAWMDEHVMLFLGGTCPQAVC
jgi:hypothetical protein